MSVRANAEFNWQVRVYYEDTDAAGVVFYANYLRYMERARTEWLRKIGFEHDYLVDEYNVLFAVKKLSIDYKKPGRLDDLLNIKSRLKKQHGASLTFDQFIRNEDEEAISDAEVRVVCLNAETLTVSPLPQDLTMALANGR